MVVDTSALFAILVGEDERDQFEDKTDLIPASQP